MSDRTIYLIDGENLVLRYQEMLKTEDYVCPKVIHHEDVFAWHPKIMQDIFHLDIIRVAYYTTCQGDEEKIEHLKKDISQMEYQFTYAGYIRHSNIVPYIFKKERKNMKTKSVDINLTIDALRHTYNNSVDTVILLTGDGDYIPLIKEIMRQGKQVQIWALSSGLNPQLPYISDKFKNLDRIFFPQNR